MSVAPHDLCQQAQDLLETSPINALRQLRVQQTDSAIVLSGRVNSFYQKQLAQELLRSIARECDAHECDFVNSVDVRSDRA